MCVIIDEEASEDDVKYLCERFGRIKRVKLVRDNYTKISRGVAYVDFYDEQSALSAVEKLNGHKYGSLILKVELAKPRNNNN